MERFTQNPDLAAAEDPADAGVRRARAVGLTEPGPVGPVVGSVEVAVGRRGVAHREVQVALRPPRQAVEALVDVARRHSPDEALRFQSFARGDGVRDQV